MNKCMITQCHSGNGSIMAFVGRVFFLLIYREYKPFELDGFSPFARELTSSGSFKCGNLPRFDCVSARTKTRTIGNDGPISRKSVYLNSTK